MRRDYGGRSHRVSRVSKTRLIVWLAMAMLLSRSSHKAVHVGEQNASRIAAFVFQGYFAPRCHFVAKRLAGKCR
jgi:hypothetical protein